MRSGFTWLLRAALVAYIVSQLWSFGSSPTFVRLLKLLLSIGLSIPAYKLFIICVRAAIGLFHSWFATLRLLGFRAFLRAPRVRSFDAHTTLRAHDNKLIAALSAASILLGAGWIVTGISHLLFFAMPFAFLAIAFPLNSATPPTVLFLAPSSAESYYAQAIITASCRGARVVSLLRATAPEDSGVRMFPGPMGQEDLSPAISGDVFRTHDDDQWRSLVAEIADMVALIVLDCRSISEHLLYEREVALHPERVFKTVLLVGSDNSQPLLEDAERPKLLGASSQMRIHEDDLEQRLLAFTISRRHLPNRTGSDELATPGES